MLIFLSKKNYVVKNTHTIIFTIFIIVNVVLNFSKDNFFSKKDLYLLDQYAENNKNQNKKAFEKQVVLIAKNLDIPPEWLMAVMHAESKLYYLAQNKKSDAFGLIQIMPKTAKILNTSISDLKVKTPLQQLVYVETYLLPKKPFTSLTDLYLSILYPSAREQDPCYVLYAKPSVSYYQNSGLDENKDGAVSVNDIDKKMQRVYPSAYVIEKK